MNRLQAELHRLYLPPGSPPPVPGAPGTPLVGPDGCVRAVVLELLRPAGWAELAQVWRGVQADLDLPAPAIAVSGRTGYQLWFSLGEPVPVARAAAFLEALRRRYLGELAVERIAMSPAPSAAAQPASALPPAEVAPEQWSAFVAPDLAPVFADEPWLDRPPGADAQAELLSRIESIKPEAFARAMERLAPAAQDTGPAAAAAPTNLEPRQFLLDVMRDPAVELSLRIEAAKALLR